MKQDLIAVNTGLLEKLKALADLTRLSIVELLRTGTQCNCEIATVLDISLSLVSHHMRILREAGLVVAEKDSSDARWVYYTLDSRALEELQGELAVLLDPARILPRDPSCGPGCKRY